MASILLRSIFKKSYDVYLFQLKERIDSTKLFITVFSSPFILISAFGLTSIIDLVDKTTKPPTPKPVLQIVHQFPPFMYFVFVLAGVIGMIPFHRFIAAHCQAYKMIRYLNHFRRLYYRCCEDDFRSVEWSPRIESDPNHPVPKIGFHWVSFLAILMALANTTYIVFGIALFDPSTYYFGALITAAIVLAIHVSLWKVESFATDVNGFGREVDRP